jgi:hypothetical protein
MTRIKNSQWYIAMGWQERTLPESKIEWAIDAPRNYKSPVIGGEGQIDSLGLYIFKSKPGKGKRSEYYLVIGHGLLYGNDFYIATVKDYETAKLIAIGLMQRYNTWNKVINYIKRTYKFDLRTYGK